MWPVRHGYGQEEEEDDRDIVHDHPFDSAPLLLLGGDVADELLERGDRRCELRSGVVAPVPHPERL